MIKDNPILTIALPIILVGIIFILPFNRSLTIALLLLVIWFTITNPEAGIYLVLCSIPFLKKFEVRGILVSTLDILFLSSLIGLVMNRIIYKKGFVLKTPLTLPFSLFILFLTLSILGGEGKYAGLRHLIKYLEAFLFFFYLINVLDSKERLCRVIWFSTALGVAVSLIGSSYQYFRPPPLILNIFSLAKAPLDSFPFNNYNLWAAYLNLIVFFPFAAYLVNSKPTKTLASLAAFSVLVILAPFEFSKEALFGFIGGGLVVLLCMRHRLNISLLKRLLILALVLLFPLSHLATKDLNELKRRATTVFKIGDDSFKDRLGLTKAALDQIKKHPFLGMGAGNYVYKYFGSQYLGRDDIPGHHHVHNLYLAIWMEMGLFALLSFLWIASRSLRASSKLSPANADGNSLFLKSGSSGGMVSFLVHSLMDVVVFHHIQLLLVLILAVPFVICKDRRIEYL